MPNFDAYVGLPWEDRGRTPAGLDCWGLIRLPYLDHLGIDLPSFADHYSTTADKEEVAKLVAGHRSPWFPILRGSEQRYDLALFRDRPWHIGIVDRRGWMLHMPHGKTSVVEQFTTGRHALRLDGIFRHHSLI